MAAVRKLKCLFPHEAIQSVLYCHLKIGVMVFWCFGIVVAATKPKCHNAKKSKSHNAYSRMKRFNLYYIVILLIPLLLWKLNTHLSKEIVTFYGFAENKETEINFNYPVAIGNIKVRPGEHVASNTPLLTIYRIKSKEVLEDAPFKIAELRAKEKIWKTEKQNDVETIKAKAKLEIEKLAGEKARIRNERQRKASLLKDLKTLPDSVSINHPIDSEIARIDKEISLLKASHATQIEAVQKELAIQKNPYQIEINRLQAEQQFQDATQKQQFELTAPFDGLVGNIQCKEGEHVPSYKTLITFYEPNPTIVKGFVQEDLLLHVAARDSFIVRSTKQADLFCYGEVIGLGSRIVEIPERLRKLMDVKTYGREVLVAIPTTNPFLQKEKVILEFLDAPKATVSTQPIKPIEELKTGKLVK